jgi:hypothetical protein
MPILIPIGIFLAMAAFIGAIALMFLYNTKNGALTLAAVIAGGILFTVALATTQDRLDARRRGAVLFAVALPILVGAGLSAGLIGDIPDEDRMVNVEPLLVVPDDAPVIAAENSQEFCLPVDGACEPIERWEVTPSAETEDLVFVFENLEAGVGHNVVINDLAGSPDQPEPGSTNFATSTVINGIATDAFVSPEVSWADLPEEWYFFCAIHPNMNGVGVVAGADGGDA